MGVLDNYIEPLKLLLSDSSDFIFIKDLSSTYKWCNDSYANQLNISSCEKIIGLKDSELNPLHSSLYKCDDDRVIKSRRSIAIDNPAFFTSIGVVQVAGVMKPIIGSSGEVEGLFGKTSIKHSLINKSLFEIFNTINEDNMPYIISNKGYRLNTAYGEVKISAREAESFLYLLKGLSIKDIARFMCLKPKTVESYIYNMKIKFSSESKADLFDKVLKAGLLESI